MRLGFGSNRPGRTGSKARARARARGKTFGPGVDVLEDRHLMAVSLAISDAWAVEGDRYEITTMVFRVSLSAPAKSTVTVDYRTEDGTASTRDYVAAAGTLTFEPGETFKDIVITITGDDREEGIEAFSVVLSGAVNAELADAVGLGTIQDNDWNQSDTGSRPRPRPGTRG